MVNHFIEKNKTQTHKPIKGISANALKAIVKYRWPGNIRELENAIAQAFVLCDKGYIEPMHLPEEIMEPGNFLKAGAESAIDITDEKGRIIAVLEKNCRTKIESGKTAGNGQNHPVEKNEGISNIRRTATYMLYLLLQPNRCSQPRQN